MLDDELLDVLTELLDSDDELVELLLDDELVEILDDELLELLVETELLDVDNELVDNELELDTDELLLDDELVEMLDDELLDVDTEDELLDDTELSLLELLDVLMLIDELLLLDVDILDDELLDVDTDEVETSANSGDSIWKSTPSIGSWGAPATPISVPSAGTKNQLGNAILLFHYLGIDINRAIRRHEKPHRQ
jgi:hypothetical protein